MKLSKDTAHRLLSIGLALGVLAGCDQALPLPTTAINPSVTVQQPISGSLPTATFEDPFAWVIGTPHPDAVAAVTAEALNDLAATHFEATMQSLPTANPLGPEETFAPEPTIVLLLGIIPGIDCEPLEGDSTFVTTGCWMTRIENETIRVRVSAGQQYTDTPGAIRVTVYPEADRLNGDMRIYLAPQTTGVLSLTAVAYPLIDLQSDTGLPFRFNLETRQWLDPNGTPIPVTATPTSIMPMPATPTSGGSTSTPRSAKIAMFVVGDVTNTNLYSGFSRHKPPCLSSVT